MSHWSKWILVTAVLTSSATELHAFFDEPACFRDLELNFFEPVLVGQALSLHGVSEGRWEVIITQLRSRSLDIPRIIRERTEYQVDSPLQYPFNAPRAMQLLQQALLELFTAVLSASYTTTSTSVVDPKSIEEMFAYIWIHQSYKIDACFR